MPKALYFQADDGTHGRELWGMTGDGMAKMVADITPLASSSPFGLTPFGGEMYFEADDGTHGDELWKVRADGTVVPVADINPSGSSFPGRFFQFNNELLF